MAGKAMARGSKRVTRVVDKLSKNTLADIVLDRIGAEIGEEASDEQILTRLQSWLEPVARMRGDRPIDLLSLMSHYEAMEQRYIKEQRQVVRPSAEEVAAAERVQEINTERLKTHTVDGVRRIAAVKIANGYVPHPASGS